MSQSLDFKITASNQASRVVGEVQKKVLDFGKDIGRSIVAVMGPMALLTMAFGKVMEHMEKMKQSAKDAFDWGAGLSAAAAKLGVSVEDFQKFQDIASRTGQSVENIAKAFKSAGNLIAEAKSGNKAAIESLEALGFGVQDLQKLNPEDVVQRLGDALASLESPTDKAASAFATFGDEGKELVKTLERIRGLAKSKPAGLSQEEADFLAEQKANEEAIANRERLRQASKSVVEKFLENDPEGKKIKDREMAAKWWLNTSAKEMGGINPLMGSLSDVDRIQAEVRRILQRRKEIAAGTVTPTPEAIVAGEKSAALGKERQEKPAPEPKFKTPEKEKEDIAKAAVLTVSSLREIGGGMAGEISMAEQIAKDSLEYQRRTAEALEKIIESNQPITDFTKPAPEGLVPNFALRGTYRA
jgi:hypothetical protein